MTIKRNEIADLILERIKPVDQALKNEFCNPANPVRYFTIDDLLPDELVRQIFTAFPSPDEMSLKKSLREYKYIAAQMNRYEPVLEETIYAFQDSRVVQSIAAICDLKSVMADEYLYAGGLSLMARGNFLNPHLDNSHDKDRRYFRALNLLYYVTPGWEMDNGGNLEIWPDGPGKSPLVIESCFNRLVVMETHERSWHSVSPVTADKSRCCVSNYYFSEFPIGQSSDYHVTSFRARPGHPVQDQILRADNFIRWSIKKLTGEWLFKNPHVYRK